MNDRTQSHFPLFLGSPTSVGGLSRFFAFPRLVLFMKKRRRFRREERERENEEEEEEERKKMGVFPGRRWKKGVGVERRAQKTHYIRSRSVIKLLPPSHYSFLLLCYSSSRMSATTSGRVLKRTLSASWRISASFVATSVFQDIRVTPTPPPPPRQPPTSPWKR